jgi:membrane protein implicated in regulation of membrane protease activity
MQSLTEHIAAMGEWAWFIFAVILFTLETIVPGVHFLWFGMAALIVGLLTIAAGITWPMQFVAFAVIACVMVLAVRRYASPTNVGSDEPDLNVRGAQYIGRTLVVEEAIRDGRGKVRVGDTLWPAQGPDIPKGSNAKVTGVRGTVLVVEPV